MLIPIDQEHATVRCPPSAWIRVIAFAFALFLAMPMLACRRSSSAVREPAATGRAAAAWKVDIGSNGAGSFSVAENGIVYVGGSIDRPTQATGWSEDAQRQACLFAVSPDGRIVASLPGSPPHGRQFLPPPVWVSATPYGVFATDQEGGIYAFTNDGRAVFRTTAGQPYGPPMADATGRVLAGGSGGLKSLQFTATDDPVSIVYEAGESFVNPPLAVGDGSFYVWTTHGGTLLAFNSRGELKWTRHPTAGTMVVEADGGLLIAEGFTVRSYGPEGETRWEFVAPSDVTLPAAASDGTVLFATRKGLLFAVRDGRELWTYAVEDTVLGPPILSVDGRVYVVSRAGRLTAISREGRRLFTTELGCGGVPVLGPAGRLYLSCALDHQLYAFDMPAGS